MRFIYNLSIQTYYFIVRIFSLFNRKASLWVEGRKNLLDQIALSIDQDQDHIWFHCASLGEFEQGRPLMEAFRKQNPDIKIVLTFFSPSGFENKKNFQGADHVFYLPVDTSQNAEKFIEYIQPRAAVFVKYEYWYNYLKVMGKKKIPVIFISAIFRKNQHFFRFYGSWFRKHLKTVTYFFVQNKESQALLYNIGIKNVVVSGDTRFDRVYEIRQNPKCFAQVEKFIQGSVIFMAGSTWPKDEEILTVVINKHQKGVKFILVPHEINESHIQKLINSLGGETVRYSQYNEDTFKNARVLIIDTIGMLSNLYQYASIAYIGGGFGKGIHNILEAATFGMPVIFGPNYQKFAEARELIQHGGAFCIKSADDLLKVSNTIFSNYQLLGYSSEISKNYVDSKKGATESIMVFLNTIVNPSGFKTGSVEKVNLN